MACLDLWEAEGLCGVTVESQEKCACFEPPAKGPRRHSLDLRAALLLTSPVNSKYPTPPPPRASSRAMYHEIPLNPLRLPEPRLEYILDVSACQVAEFKRRTTRILLSRDRSVPQYDQGGKHPIAVACGPSGERCAPELDYVLCDISSQPKRPVNRSA